MAPGRTRIVDMKKRSSDRKKIASQKVQEAREAALNEQSDISSVTNMNLDPLPIDVGQRAAIEGLAGLIQMMRAEFATLAETLTQRLDAQATKLDAQAATIQTLLEDIASLKAENIALANAQKRSIQVPSGGSPTYAAIARTPPNSYPSNLSPISSGVTAPSKNTDTPYCTIDMSRASAEEKSKTNPAVVREAIEKEVRNQQGKEGWRCIAVTRDAKNHDRIRITGRDAQEIKTIKEAADKVVAAGSRVLRDQLYPIKVDNARKDGILNTDGSMLPGITESLGKENEASVAKVAWISKRDNGKAYGSMIVYLHRGSDANRLLQEGYFHINGESGFTNVFERRPKPDQCYNCQAAKRQPFARGAPSKDTIIVLAPQNRDVYRVVAPTNRIAETVECSTHLAMSSTLQTVQLNVRKQSSVQLSLMNDPGLQHYSAIAISEPYVWRSASELITTPMGHASWVKMLPTTQSEDRWAVRSMLWVHKDVRAEQISVDSHDLTAAILYLQEYTVLVVSTYIPGGDQQALATAIYLIDKLINDTRRKAPNELQLLLLGDFNRHDQLWGGDEIDSARQGEADPIIELMGAQAIHSLLPRGTKTWQRGESETTIDLTLATTELAASMTKCRIHETEHGSDHRAIVALFDMVLPPQPQKERILFKSAPWNNIRDALTYRLRDLPLEASVQEQADYLTNTVRETVWELTPRAKPSPYTKRWWTADLTHLRTEYTRARNRARAWRRQAQPALELEAQAKQAAKRYHDAIRNQKKAHWRDFLADNTNIWQAARYIDPASGSCFDKTPTLIRGDGTATADNREQAAELLSTFFPPLPEEIQDEPLATVKTPVNMPPLTLQEVESRIMAASPWKAPGDDGLPMIVWRQVWPVAKYYILHLFQSSLEKGELPNQWRNAKIIPLKKPGKGDYTKAKAWRPISLLPTLGKVLEAVVADRLSYAVETHALLPTNHFGARKQRSTEQALILLQERIYKAWRQRKVLSLVSFDVKGAYNGVYKERLLQRLRARRIPLSLCRWIDAFCSDRTATLSVNGYDSEKQALPQAGLPQGSPLSPILFLFFNADLVEKKINDKGGAIAFVDDYTAWVTGPSAEANTEGLQNIVSNAMSWEQRSGATFEGEKTVLIHFTRNTARLSDTSINIKGQEVRPAAEVKLLGVIMDRELRFRNHMALAATRGLKAAMALKRLQMTSPSMARQLFTCMIAPVVDYAMVMWRHACNAKAMVTFNRVQRIGAQAVTGAFATVSTAVAEAEAYLKPIRIRHSEKAAATWIRLRTLPPSHPLAKLGILPTRRFNSPLCRLSAEHTGTPSERVEKIEAYSIQPWALRLQGDITREVKSKQTAIDSLQGILIATSASDRNDKVSAGGAIRDTENSATIGRDITYSRALGPRREQNPYTAELAAISQALRCLPEQIQGRSIYIITRGLSAVKVLMQPRQQSGQREMKDIYRAAEKLQQRGCRIQVIWMPTKVTSQLQTRAKKAAKILTRKEAPLEPAPYQARSTTTKRALEAIEQLWILPQRTGNFTAELDRALPGKHTQKLYDGLRKAEAKVLIQLRTSMGRINEYLYRIGATETPNCACGVEKENVKHFLFRCNKWNIERAPLRQQLTAEGSALSLCLGGKALSDLEDWSPDMNAVKATIKFALDTGRLDYQPGT